MHVRYRFRVLRREPASLLQRGGLLAQRVGALTHEHVLGAAQTFCDRRDATKREPHVRDCAVLDTDCCRESERGPVVLAELHVGRAHPRRKAGHTDGGEHLVRGERRFVRACLQVGDGDRADACGACYRGGRLVDEQQRGRIGVRLREAEVTGERSHVADAQVRYAVLDLRKERQPLADDGVVLDGGVRRGSAYRYRIAVAFDGVETGDALHIDEVAVVQQPRLHREQQLGAARVEARRIAML